MNKKNGIIVAMVVIAVVIAIPFVWGAIYLTMRINGTTPAQIEAARRADSLMEVTRIEMEKQTQWHRDLMDKYSPLNGKGEFAE